MKAKFKATLILSGVAILLSLISFILYLFSSFNYHDYMVIPTIALLIIAALLFKVEEPGNTSRVLEMKHIEDRETIQLVAFDEEKRIGKIKIKKHKGIYNLHINGALGFKEIPEIDSFYFKNSNMLIKIDPKDAPKAFSRRRR